MKIKPIILFIVLASFACGSKKTSVSGETELQQTSVPDYIHVAKNYIEVDVPTQKKPVPHSVMIDSTFIHLPGFDKGSQPLFSVEKSNLLIATSKSDKAYVLNLNSMKVEKEYQLRQALDQNQSFEEEPCDCALDLAVDLQGLDFYTNQNIVLQVNFKLLIIGPSGNIVDSIPLKDPNDSPKFIYANIYDVPIDYNPLTNKIYLYKYCYNCKSGSRYYYSHPLEVGIDANNKKMVDEKVKYPEIYSLFGLTAMDNVYRTSYENFQYFSFFADHRIYVYNILNQQINVYGGQSSHSTGKIRTSSKLEKDFDKMLESMQGNDLYFQLVHDDVNKKYYRLFIHPDKYDITLDRIKYHYYIQIFDQHFNLLDEIKFEKGFGAYYFSFGGKLYWVVLKKNGVVLYGYTFK